jgi:hypothetical protein
VVAVCHWCCHRSIEKKKGNIPNRAASRASLVPVACSWVRLIVRTWNSCSKWFWQHWKHELSGVLRRGLHQSQPPTFQIWNWLEQIRLYSDCTSTDLNLTATFWWRCRICRYNGRPYGWSSYRAPFSWGQMPRLDGIPCIRHGEEAEGESQRLRSP